MSLMHLMYISHGNCNTLTLAYTSDFHRSAQAAVDVESRMN